MFTGLVRELGKVRGISRAGGIRKIAVEAKVTAVNARIGDSVAVNGACLTVTQKKGSILSFDAVEETINKTTLGSLKNGDEVNLEESLRSGDPIGGHFVLGHVDCVGTIRAIKKTEKNIAIDISFPKEYGGLVVEKGSVALDGISLTIGEASAAGFKVYIIPHTFEATTLKYRKAGDGVNIEFDILGKYILRQKELGKKGLTEEYLREKGFI